MVSSQTTYPVYTHHIVCILVYMHMYISCTVHIRTYCIKVGMYIQYTYSVYACVLYSSWRCFTLILRHCIALPFLYSIATMEIWRANNIKKIDV